MVVNSKGNTKPSPSSACVMVVPPVIIGNPAEVIIDICNNNEKVDLIIMGSTGLKGI
jgi:nucleotide-binding universal stress UspA family protein